MKKYFWIGWISVISLLENSAYKITPLDSKNNNGPLKNAQPGFNCELFSHAFIRSFPLKRVHSSGVVLYLIKRHFKISYMIARGISSNKYKQGGMLIYWRSKEKGQDYKVIDKTKTTHFFTEYSQLLSFYTLWNRLHWLFYNLFK